MIQGTDYTVEYSNNIDPGTAKVTVTGMGDYVGGKSAEFMIYRMYDVSHDMLGHGDPMLVSIVRECDIYAPMEPFIKEADCVNSWNEQTDTVTKNTTLYAFWRRNVSYCKISDIAD